MYKVTIKNGDTATIIHDGSLINRSVARIADGKVSKAVNSIDSLSFLIYPNNPGYNLINGMVTTVEVTEIASGKKIFIGRVLKPSDSMDNAGLICKTVTCEGRLGWLYDSIQPYSSITYATNGLRSTLNAILSQHNAIVDDSKKIKLGATTIETSDSFVFTRNWENSLDCITKVLLDRYGGELQLRDGSDGSLYLDWLDRIGTGTDTKIELAVNLKSITREIDETAVITRLYPLGARIDNTERRTTISSVNNSKNYIENEELVAKYGIISGTQIWDDVTVPANLLTKAKAYFSTLNAVKKQYKITALDLSKIGMDFETFELGNTYRVVNPLMGIDEDLRIIGITIDLDNPHLSELTFGDKMETMTGFTANKSKSLQSAIDESEFKNREVMDAKIENATQLITGAQGGNVILDPSEKPSRILIMDTANIDTCTSCIQLNKNGIGFWNKAKDGGNAKDGPYTNAWTIDGNLVASFITASTLTGLKINNGSGTFTVGEDGTVNAKAINITGGTINIETNTNDYDVISLNCGDWHLELSPLQLKLTNSTIGSNIVMQAGGIFCKWNNENKVFIGGDSGNIYTYTNGGKTVFSVDTNNKVVSFWDGNGNQTAYVDTSTGMFYGKQFVQV